MKYTSLLTAAACALLACESTESADINTGAIYADLRITADGSGSALAYAGLKVGGSAANTFLQLSEGDALTATSGPESQTMARKDALGAVWYEATLSGDAEDQEFVISFTRTADSEGDTRGGSAPSSVATLPAPFDIATPAAASEFSRISDSIAVSWGAGSDDALTWSAIGNCIEAYTGSNSNDPGSITIASGSLQPVDDDPEASCDVVITVERWRSGSVDSAYGEGGAFRARQIRTVTIQSEE